MFILHFIAFARFLQCSLFIFVNRLYVTQYKRNCEIFYKPHFFVLFCNTLYGVYSKTTFICF